MSTLKTLSSFYYGFMFTKDNQNLNFDEGVGELTAQIKVGDYTLNEMILVITNAFNLVGSNEYSVVIDRLTRKITISANANFNLLSFSGSQAGTSAYELLGFDVNSNYTGANSYQSDNGSGYEYRPQTLLRDYIQPEDHELKESAVVSTSANGQVQTVAFGDGSRMQCNIIAVTNLVNTKNNDFYENPNGLEDCRKFMRYLITKSKLEFIPDIVSPQVFYKLLLESTEADKSGIGYKIKNMQGSNNYYTSGVMLFRKVIDEV